jgi:hypothetical protein
MFAFHRVLGLTLPAWAIAASLANAQVPATAPHPTPAPPVASPAAAAPASDGFTLDTPIADIAASPEGKAVLDKDLPGLTSHPFYAAFKTKSLKALQPMSNGLIDDAALARTLADLAALSPSSGTH